MRTIDQCNFKDKRVLIRVDFNVPLDANFKVTDPTRILSAKPTIEKVLAEGGAVILMSHLGRPKGKQDAFSLRHILSAVTHVLNHEVKFAEDCIGDEAFEQSAHLKPGAILLLENLRFYEEEKAGDPDFARKLANHGEVYVNDAFGTAHRAHASTAIIAQFFKEKYVGYLIEREVKSLDKVLHSKEHPVTAILGGAKVSSKITVIEQILDRIDNLIIGGGMAYTFIKAQKGAVGDSLVEEAYVPLARNLLKKAQEKNVRLILPVDTAIADSFSNDAVKKTADISQIPEGFMGLDIGEKSIALFSEIIASSKIILWNGPMGVFEFSNFEKGTKAVGEAVAKATGGGAFSLVGGGDSVAAAKKYGLVQKVSYISTGGGAMLEMLEGKTLPGIAAIEE